MAYNLFSISNKPINWEMLNNSISFYKNSLEYIPIPSSDDFKHDSLGISIPSSRINKNTWNELKSVIKILLIDFKMQLIDLYAGNEITIKNYKFIKKNLFG